MELQKMREQLIEWMDMMKNGYRDSNIYMYEEFCPAGMRFRIKLFTDVNEYSIVAYANYLGCVFSSRRPRAGEDWTRGGDLSDGKFSYETWVKILSDIVGTELVKIHRPVKDLYTNRSNNLIGEDND